MIENAAYSSNKYLQFQRHKIKMGSETGMRVNVSEGKDDTTEGSHSVVMATSSAFSGSDCHI